MRLFELDQVDPLVTKLVVMVSKLKDDLETGEADPNMTVQQLLQLFRKNDIFVDKSDLYTMIKKLPLKKLINNIQGDNIIFKGFGTPGAPPEDESKKIVANMAQQATGNA